jgi:hypothetical protein
VTLFPCMQETPLAVPIDAHFMTERLARVNGRI